MNKKFSAIGWITMAAMIFYASSQPYTKQDIREEISTAFNWVPKFFVGGLDWISFSYAGKLVSIKALGIGGFIEFFIRKAAHFGAFFLLAFFFFCFLMNWFKEIWKGSLFTAIFSFFYALSDEYHQMLTGGRTPLLHDVGIDCFGALFGILLGYLWLKRLKSSVQ